MAKKKRIVSRAIFLKTDAAEQLFYFNFYSAENRCGYFFFEIQTIFSDIIQVRPLNLIVKASAH